MIQYGKKSARKHGQMNAKIVWDCLPDGTITEICMLAGLLGFDEG